jgi:prepilin-type N-terminal cleavage/methylation domain-containing protein
MRKNIYAFTLVELIVVITIVGILSTVGFVSYSGYLTSARDSNRYSQMTKLSDSLQVYAATKSLPLPDDYVEITNSGSVIAYQGYVGTDVLETIDYTNGGKDPKDDSYFTYMLSKDRKSLQLLALMEESVAYAP